MILLLSIVTVVVVTSAHATVTADEYWSGYNGSYCGRYFENEIRVVMPDDHDVLMNEYLTDLRISGFEMIISEACYSNIVAVLCYATLKICQSGSNETSQICYDNCTDFNSVIMNECPYFVISRFSQLISNSSPCENLNNQRSCISLDNIVSDMSPITNSSGRSHVHTNCIPFQGPTECIPYMKYSFFYSYASDYQSVRAEISDIINEPNCDDSRTIQYICNNIFPVCDIISGEPILICEDDCLVATSQSNCNLFLEASSLNCSNPVYLIEGNVISDSSDQCTTLPAITDTSVQLCVPIPVENCEIVLRRNYTLPQHFSGSVGSVFRDSSQINTSSKCMISLTYVSCYFAFLPCDPMGGLPVRLCPEDCIVPDAISLYACKEVYDVIRASNSSVGQVIREFNCSDPSTYINTEYSPNECLSIVTLRELFAEEIEEYRRIINENSSSNNEDDDNKLLYIVVGVVVGVFIVVSVIAILILCCVKKYHCKKSDKFTVGYSSKNDVVQVPGEKFRSDDSKKRASLESDHKEYVNPIDSLSTKDSIHSRKIQRQAAFSDDYYNCHDLPQDQLGHHASLYLSSDEVSDMDASFLITRDDLYHLSDGKIMSALLPRNSLVIDSVLGEGAFGKVYKGYLNQSLVRRLSISHHSKTALIKQKGDNELTVAIKTIKGDLNKQECLDLIKESAIMKTFDHPNVLGLVGISLNTEDGTPMIAIPFMKYGDLKTFLVAKRRQTKVKNTLPEGVSYNLLVKMCLDVAKGMEYLASRRFVHRDLAARNCMLDDEFTVKIADFGLTREVFSKDYYKVKTSNKLPVKWMALESLHDKISNQKTDVWSFGVTCWEIFSLGRQPYPGVQSMEVVTLLEHEKRLLKPLLCEEIMYKIMYDCWLEDPDDRPTFSALVKSITDLIKPHELELLESLKKNYNPEAAKNILGIFSSLSESNDVI